MYKETFAMDNKLPDWEIGKLYNQAWNIIKKNKVLWIFGLASGAGMSFNFNLPFNFDSNNLKDIQQNIQSFPSEIASSPLLQVLGSSTSKSKEMLSYLFSSIPISFYIILGIEILAVIVLFTIIGLIYSAWSKAALLEGIQSSTSYGEVSIRDSSEKAFSHIKSLVWIQVVPPLILGLGFIVLSILILIIIIITSFTVKVVLGLLSLAIFLLMLYGFIYYMLSEIWATRIAVVEKKAGKESLIRGYRIARKKKWSMILLGFVNTIMTFFITAIPIFFLLGITIGTIFATDKNQIFGIGLFVVGAIFIIPIIIAMTLLGGILNGFKAVIWSIAYNNIRGKYDPSTLQQG